jgi:hypothetical protein
MSIGGLPPIPPCGPFGTPPPTDPFDTPPPSGPFGTPPPSDPFFPDLSCPPFAGKYDYSEMKAETVETRWSERAEAEQLLRGKLGHDLGIGDQTAGGLGDALDQLLKRINHNRR